MSILFLLFLTLCKTMTQSSSCLGRALIPSSSFSVSGLSGLSAMLSHLQRGPADEPAMLNYGQNNLEASECEQKYRQHKDVIVEAWGRNNSLNRASVIDSNLVSYQKRLACHLATKWQKPYSVIMSWVRIRTQFTIIRSIDPQLRGTRRRICGLGLQDGAAIGVGF